MIVNRLPKIHGTKKIINRNLLLISSGLPSLDTIFGGGIPVGSCCLIEEDAYAVYSNIILKHYLAEGVVNQHSLLLASQDTCTHEIMKELPAPLLKNTINGNAFSSVNRTGDSSCVSPAACDQGQLRIAWRYQNLPNEKLLDPSTSLFGNTFDMGRNLSESDLASVDVNHWDRKFIVDCSYENLFDFVKRVVQNPRYSFNAPVENRTVLRIVLHSLGTPSWNGDLNVFLIKLRWLILNSGATCLITIPSRIFEDVCAVHSCEHFCDTVLSVKSLLSECNPAYRDYEGLLIIKKLPAVNSWCPVIPDSNDWAFKVKKKHFIIEKLHISPEEQERVHREEEDVANDYQTKRILANVADQF